MGNQWKRRAAMFVSGIRALLKQIKILSAGQTVSADILQLAHRLEKGLTIRSPKKLWGWEKAKALCSLIVRADPVTDKFAIETGKGVLNAYITAKKATEDQEEIQKVQQLESSLEENNISLQQANNGGAVLLTAEEVAFSTEEKTVIEKLFNTRHSVRDYSEERVSQEALLQAIQLANQCPSACNRQPTKVYVISAEERETLGYPNEYNATQYLIITGCVSSFKTTEMNDWIVSAAIFAGYLTLSLHAQGIGSCVIRKNLVKDTEYNKVIRSFCSIPEREQIVLELAIGKYKDTFKVPVSNRLSAHEIVIPHQ